MRIVIFTLKLACLFLVCSLPYKLAVLLFGLGVHSSVPLIRALGMVRMLYHILDGWTFCANSELLDAIRAMLGGCCCGRLCGCCCHPPDDGERGADTAARAERGAEAAGCAERGRAPIPKPSIF